MDALEFARAHQHAAAALESHLNEKRAAFGELLAALHYYRVDGVRDLPEAVREPIIRRLASLKPDEWEKRMQDYLDAVADIARELIEPSGAVN